MARRRRTIDEWTLDRGTSPDKARRHIEAALVGMAGYAATQGLSLEMAFAVCQRVFELDQVR